MFDRKSKIPAATQYKSPVAQLLRKGAFDLSDYLRARRPFGGYAFAVLIEYERRRADNARVVAELRDEYVEPRHALESVEPFLAIVFELVD